MNFTETSPETIAEMFLNSSIKEEQAIESRLAIVLHSNASMSNTCVTKHPISNGVMGLGQIISIDDLERVVSEFASHTAQISKPNAEFLEPNILAKSSNLLAWYRPRQSKVIYVKNKSFKVTMPPLLFVFKPAKHNSVSSLSVFALAANKRPTLQTKLFHAPFFNVYNDGRLCLGSMQIPKIVSANTIEIVESEFFGSKFTHPNCDNLTRNKQPLEKLYADKEKSGKRILTSELVPMKRTVGQVI